MEDLLQSMRRLVREHDDASNNGYDLWSWLPSYQHCKQMHGDLHHHISQPSFATLMGEATFVFVRLAYLARGEDVPYDDEVQAWFGCPCEDCRGSGLNLSKEEFLAYLSQFWVSEEP